MPVFAYRARHSEREEYEESGYVVARNESDAKEKLKRMHAGTHIRVKPVKGLKALVKWFTADVR